MKSKQKTDEPELTGTQVAEYLSANPDFFSDRDSLLALMTLPHQQGGAVSLVERQVSVLRDRNRSTKNHLDDLLNAARRNNEIFDKCQSLILSLLAAKDAITFFDALESGLKHEFDCHAYSLVIFSDDPEQINIFTSRVSLANAKEYVGDLIKGTKPSLGALRPSEQDFLFPNASSKVKSAAVLPIKTRSINKDATFEHIQIALLSIGSNRKDYFDASMDTLFIGFVADVLAQLLPLHIPVSNTPPAKRLEE